MSFPRFTLLGLLAGAVSLGLSLYHFFFHPAPLVAGIDLRLLASIASLVSYGMLIGELKKHAGNYQVLGLFLALITLGISIDHALPFLPFISTAMFLSFLSFKKYFRQWFSETTWLWLDPVLVISALGCYVYGNIEYAYGWKGWVLPALPLGFNSSLILMDFMFATGTIKYVTEKKLIHETGKSAPDFCLRDHEGNDVRLSDFEGKRDVLLMFVRNAWCPSCHIMLRTYQRNSEKFKNKNVLLCAIGPNNSEVNKQMAVDLGIDFKILSDEGQKTAMAYRVHLPSEFLGQQFTEGMPLPASFLIDKKGIIRYTSRPDRIGEFFAPETIFPILESLN